MVLFLALIVVAITAGGMALSNSSESVSQDGVQSQSSGDAMVDPVPESESTSASSGEDDYYEYDGIFSYRWSDLDRTDSCDGCSYWMLDLKTTVDCSVVFVEMEVTNSAGDIVETISKETYDVKAGVAKLVTLDTWRDDAASGDVSEMNCQE